MAQDIVADGLNQIMNAKMAGQKEAKIKRVSKVLTGLLDMMKEGRYIDYELFNVDENEKKPYVVVKILKLNECRAIKPRFFVKVGEIDKYLRRYLVSRNFGIVVVSTNKGLMTQDQAIEDKIGGSLIAYFY